MKYLNCSEYGAKVGVSKQRVMQWIHTGRLVCWKPKDKVYLISDKEPKPDERKPGRPVKALSE